MPILKGPDDTEDGHYAPLTGKEFEINPRKPWNDLTPKMQQFLTKVILSLPQVKTTLAKNPGLVTNDEMVRMTYDMVQAGEVVIMCQIAGDAIAGMLPARFAMVEGPKFPPEDKDKNKYEPLRWSTGEIDDE